MSTKRLIILMVNTDPRNGEELGAPFYHAMVAASLDYEVDVVCTATAGRLMRKGVAESLRVKEGSDVSVHHFISEAHKLGVRFWVCSANLPLFDMTVDDLIPECRGIIGMAGVMRDIMEDECKVLTY
jgi:uncharacterized protein